MKKLVFLFASVIGVSCSFAQTTTPRFGMPPGDDNTGRVLTYGYKAATIATNISLLPKYYETFFTVATTSISPTFSANVSYSYLGDKMTVFIASNSTGTRTLTIGTNMIGSAATQTLAASKKAVFEFRFDGAKYIQTAFTAEP